MNFFTKKINYCYYFTFLMDELRHIPGCISWIKKIYFRAGIIWLVRLPHWLKTFEEPLGTLSKWTVPSITLKTDQLTFLWNPKNWMSSSHFSLIMFVYVSVGYINAVCCISHLVWLQNEYGKMEYSDYMQFAQSVAWPLQNK